MLANIAMPPIRAPIPTNPVCSGFPPALLLLVDGPAVEAVVALGATVALGAMVAMDAVAPSTAASRELNADSREDATVPVEMDDSSAAREEDSGPASAVMLAISLAIHPSISPPAEEMAFAALEAAPATYDPTSLISEPKESIMSRRGLATGAGVVSGALGTTGFAYH